MKGAGYAWIFGLMMVLIVVAVFVTGVVHHYNAQVMIVASSVEAYRTLHIAELIKRTIEGAGPVNVQLTAKSLGKSGGGYPVWTNTTPDMQDLVRKFETEFEMQMDMINFNGLGGREIQWQNCEAKVEKFTDNSVEIFGNKSFVVINLISTPYMEINNTGAFHINVATSYFKLLRIGLQAASCPPEIGKKTVDGFTQEIFPTEKGFSVKIIDPNSKLKLVYILKCKK